MIDFGGVKLEKVSVILFILILYMFFIFKIKNLLKDKVKNTKKK